MKHQAKRRRRSLPPRQLSLSLQSIKCRHGEECAAPLCPKDIDFAKQIWFPHEPICRLRHAPEWVQRQRQIKKLPGIDPGKYFTFRMLKAINEVKKGLQGANPDYVTAESIWFNWWHQKSPKRSSPTTSDNAPQAIQKEIEGFSHP